MGFCSILGRSFRILSYYPGVQIPHKTCASIFFFFVNGKRHLRAVAYLLRLQASNLEYQSTLWREKIATATRKSIVDMNGSSFLFAHHLKSL